MAAGAAIALGRRGWLVGLPVLLGLLCIGSELFLAPEVAAVRPSTLGAANTEETQQRFRVLHAISLGDTHGVRPVFAAGEGSQHRQAGQLPLVGQDTELQ